MLTTFQKYVIQHHQMRWMHHGQNLSNSFWCPKMTFDTYSMRLKTYSSVKRWMEKIIYMVCFMKCLNLDFLIPLQHIL